MGPRSLCLGSLELEGFRPRRRCPHIGLTLFSLGGTSLSNYKQVLGPHHEVYEVERHPGESDIQFYVEGLVFPDTNFSGLISLSVSLVSTEVSARWGPGQERAWGTEGSLEPTKSQSAPLTQALSEVSLFTDSVTFRVAPWIMTPNTQPPLELYVCR